MPSFAARWLLPRIGRFFAAHPDIDLDVRASMALVDFRRDDVEAALRYGGGNWPGVVRSICSTTILPGVQPAPRERPAADAPGGDLALPAAALRQRVLAAVVRAAGLDWPEPARGPIFNDASHLMQAAVEGQGIALARSSLIGNDMPTACSCGCSTSKCRRRGVTTSSILRASRIAQAQPLSRLAARRDCARRRDAERAPAACVPAAAGARDGARAEGVKAARERAAQVSRPLRPSRDRRLTVSGARLRLLSRPP